MAPKHPLVGQPAPALELPCIPEGDLYRLPIGEKPIALFFFPQANTTGCTKEACAFRDAQTSNITFKRHPDLDVVGISSDSTAKQQSFADQYKLPYRIISDAEESARKAYKVDKAFMGLVPGRATFFIDAKGIIRGVCTKNIDFSAHTKFVEEMLILVEKEDK
ncbi:hypothetical protein FFLO_06325 [Filobasidium floriforme]|uniref:thioredoxin-dependent peroxiredoxin n=1 Tax=Filobasidium floriforme TaxID=5210 RepID=A0A8K0NM96_9TREE|nr:thioredoxin-like protein [Filobasidium floriforme]KAG7528210.1 hypothetical protein FFLO_06325 [Filobasidium floriforme]KAH8084269.1 thioredoxin-like protein [Filobasidium floriforme]